MIDLSPSRKSPELINALFEARRTMRTLTLFLLVLTVACDPGADFTLVGHNGPDVVWAAGDDSVHGRLSAHVFTVSLSIRGKFNAPATVVLALDTVAGIQVNDVNGVPLHVDRFTDACDEPTRPARRQWRSCVFDYLGLHSTNYDRLDTLTVQFGYAITKQGRVPLTARFARIREGHP